MNSWNNSIFLVIRRILDMVGDLLEPSSLIHILPDTDYKKYTRQKKGLNNMKIELITCDAGDWYVLKVDDKIWHEGHDIPYLEWLSLLGSMGHEVIENEISDEDMEEGNY